MGTQIVRVVDVLEVGPRKITKVGGKPIVYLGKRFENLVGRNVIVVLKVIEEATS